MVCIIRSKYQNELKQLSGILGGEKAAHYALCMNNGYNLTDTKEGKHSKLFDQLKEKYGEDEAIRMKTYIFTPQFTEKFGDWYNQAVENTDENDLKHKLTKRPENKFSNHVQGHLRNFLTGSSQFNQCPTYLVDIIRSAFA